MVGTKAFQAYGVQGSATAATAREAAEAFFAKFPNRRKCDVVEGRHDGVCFTRIVNLNGKQLTTYRDVTKKTVSDLPAHEMESL